MLRSRRLTPLFLASSLTFALFLWYLSRRSLSIWQIASHAVGPSEEEIASGKNILPDLRKGKSLPEYYNPKAEAQFGPGTPKPPGSKYTRTLVIPRLSSENTSWIEEELSEMLAPQGPLSTAIYVVDDPIALLHPPRNKGHEVMVYLTYIISHYDNLPDIAIFMHAHRWAWHNNAIMDNDAASMIRYLSPEHVTRVGYMNMRCHWDPGCPDWLHPAKPRGDMHKQEEGQLAATWSEIFPGEPMPAVLAQPCCAQFALSKARMLAVPRERYVQYRDWVLRTTLDDYMSGRMFEYTWQFLFTGRNVECPAMHACYCDGYGLCFGGAAEFDEWFELGYNLRECEAELELWWRNKAKIEALMETDGHIDEAAAIDVPVLGRDAFLEKRIAALSLAMSEKREAAFQQGLSPQARAEEVGRVWKEGDGF